MTHCVFVYFSQDTQRTVRNSAERRSLSRVEDVIVARCLCALLLFDVCVASEMVEVGRAVSFVSS